MISIIFATILITLITVIPIWAWPVTRKLTLPALALYFLFLLIKFKFVAGIEGTYHDTHWTFELYIIIVRQWLESGVDFGWNPYSGGGQPIGLANNLFMVFPTFFLFYLFKVLGLEVSSRVFFNLVFIFGFFNVCTGSLLLIRLLNRNLYICIIGFSSMLFGGLFASDLGSSFGLFFLTFTSYALFFLVYFFKYKRIESLLFFFLLVGLSTGYYIALYTLIPIALFLLFAALGYWVKSSPDYQMNFRESARALLAKPGVMVFGVALMIMASGSALYIFYEMQDFVSPTRGFASGGATMKESYQGTVAVKFENYKKIFDYFEDRPINLLSMYHSTFYLGMIPTLGFFIAIFTTRKYVFHLTAFCLVILSVGNDLPVWGWVTSLPILDMMRHSFLFGKTATFFILMGSLFGLSSLLDSKLTIRRKLTAIAISSALVFGIHPSTTIVIALLLSIIILVLISLWYSRGEPQLKDHLIFWLLAVFFIQLAGHPLHLRSNRQIAQTTNPELREFRYPDRWQSLPSKRPPSPFNLYSLLDKYSAWSIYDPNYGMFIQKEFSEFLIEQKLLVKDINEERPQMVRGKIFNLVPRLDSWSPDQHAAHFLSKTFSGISKPTKGEGKSDREDTGPKSPDPAGIKSQQFDRLLEQVGRVIPKASNDANRITLTVQVEHKAYLFRMENFHQGWQASVDGRETPILKVYPNFQMIPLEPGEHLITFSFSSPYHKLAYLNFFVALMGLILLPFWLNAPVVFGRFTSLTAFSRD